MNYSKLDVYNSSLVPPAALSERNSLIPPAALLEKNLLIPPAALLLRESSTPSAVLSTKDILVHDIKKLVLTETKIDILFTDEELFQDDKKGRKNEKNTCQSDFDYMQDNHKVQLFSNEELSNEELRNHLLFNREIETRIEILSFE